MVLTKFVKSLTYASVNIIADQIKDFLLHAAYNDDKKNGRHQNPCRHILMWEMSKLKTPTSVH